MNIIKYCFITSIFIFNNHSSFHIYCYVRSRGQEGGCIDYFTTVLALVLHKGLVPNPSRGHPPTLYSSIVNVLCEKYQVLDGSTLLYATFLPNF